MGDAVNYVRISQFPWALEVFERSLDFHHQAKQAGEIESLGACADSLPSVQEGVSKFRSLYHLERDKETLPLEEFTHECLHNIGGLVEACLKPVIKELLCQIRVVNGRVASFSVIDALDLGAVVNELMAYITIPNALDPCGVRINQWRNIAQHYSAQVISGKIKCGYGHPTNRREIELSRSELFEVALHISVLFTSLRLASTVFFFDNFEDIKAHNLLRTDIDLRPEIKVMSLVAALAGQGFEVTELRHDEKEAFMVVRETSTEDPNMRKIHTTQFVWPLWEYTNSKKVTVEYHELDGTSNFRTSAISESFERVIKENLSANVVAGESEITDLKTGICAPGYTKHQRTDTASKGSTTE